MDSSTIKHLLNNEADTNAQKIGFLLLNEFSLLAFASAIEPFTRRQPTKWQTYF